MSNSLPLKASPQEEATSSHYFELPVAGTCLGCGHLIRKGTQFLSARDSLHLNMQSILKYTMSCPHCHKKFGIRTNPQKRGFDYVAGIVKQKGKDRKSNRKRMLLVAEQNEFAASKPISDEDIREIQIKKRPLAYDADMNAHLRASFRKDREQRKLPQENLKTASCQNTAVGLFNRSTTQVATNPKKWGGNQLSTASSNFCSGPKKRRPIAGTTPTRDVSFPERNASSVNPDTAFSNSPPLMVPSTDSSVAVLPDSIASSDALETNTVKALDHGGNQGVGKPDEYPKKKKRKLFVSHVHGSGSKIRAENLVSNLALSVLNEYESESE